MGEGAERKDRSARKIENKQSEKGEDPYLAMSIKPKGWSVAAMDSRIKRASRCAEVER